MSWNFQEFEGLRQEWGSAAASQQHTKQQQHTGRNFAIGSTISIPTIPIIRNIPHQTME